MDIGSETYLSDIWGDFLVFNNTKHLCILGTVEVPLEGTQPIVEWLLQ